MKLSQFIAVFIAVSVFLYSCDPNEPASPPEIEPGPIVTMSSYPLSIGSEWEYHMDVDVTGPDAGHTDYTVRYEVLLDTSFNGLNTKKMRQYQSVNGGLEMYLGDRYFHQTASKLDLVAVNGSSGQVFFKQDELSQLVSINSLFQDYDGENVTQFTVLDSAIHLLRYPSLDNDVWRSNETGWEFDLKRKWVGYYTVTTEAGSFDCIKLELFRDEDNDGLPDPDWFELYQYFSPSYGLIMEVQISQLNYIGGETGELVRKVKLVEVNL